MGRLVELRKEEVTERLPGASRSSWNLVHRATRRVVILLAHVKK